MIFSTLKIQNFRGIRKACVRDLSCVNLFYGKNNSGKSSLLEAVFLLAGQSNPLLPIQANAIRGIADVSEKTISYDFYQSNPNNIICIEAQGMLSRCLSIRLIQSNSHQVALKEVPLGKTDSAEGYFGLELSYRLNGDEVGYRSHIVVSTQDTTQAKVNKDDRYTESLFARYIPSSNSMQFGTTAEGLADIIKNKHEQDILRVLQMIEPKIRDIQVVGQEVMVDVGLEQRIPINILGDGVRKALGVIVAIYECRNGILVIDELDNGLHFSVMESLWKAVLGAVKEYNVQMFVSTHNYDMLRGLVGAAQGEAARQEMISTYKLIKKHDDEVVALRYGYDALAYAVEQEMEVR